MLAKWPKWYHCDFCGDKAREEDLFTTATEELVCEDCVDNAVVVTCEGCDELVDADTIHLTADDMGVCPDCWEDTHTCDFCNRHFYMSRDIHEDSAGTTLCYDCLESFYICFECDRFVHYDDAHWEEWSERIYCPDCAPEDVPIYDYSHKPDPEFYGDGPAYLGVELEVEAPRRLSSFKEIVEDILQPELYLKRDGSLDNGFEIVSHPCSLDYHMNSFGWEDILERLRQDGFRSHDAGTCGLHVHISRDAFGDSPEEQELNITKLVYIVEKFWDEMVKFSRRNSMQLSRWAERYLSPWEEVDPKVVAEKVAVTKRKYVAVNLIHYHTVELRLWRGTLNAETFFATLQFCQFLVELATSKDIDELRKLTWEEVLELVEESGHEELISYMEKRFA